MNDGVARGTLAAMRPDLLFPLFADISTLKGVGPQNRRLIERLVGGTRIIDLLRHLPTGLIDRSSRPRIMEARAGDIVTIDAMVDAHQPPDSPRLPYRVLLRDETGFLTLAFFHARADWLMRLLPPGERRVVSGRLEIYGGRPQIVHPDHVLTPKEAEELPLLEPVYPMTQGLGRKALLGAVSKALEHVPALPEWLMPAVLAREGWPSFPDALRSVHRPQMAGDIAPESPARRRLAYDELLANQLALALVRMRMRVRRGRSLKGTGEISGRLRAGLPFRLTGDQEAAIAEIIADMESDTAMLRLLQGDVGSGKTAVALLAMARAVEAGAQAAMLAPTEILARQHLATIAPIAEAAGLRVALLTGRVKGRTRQTLLEDLAAGHIDILIGTHALLTEDVVFRDLGLAVIDEQHRFGVFQRLALGEKAHAGLDMLVMTATPIPRTLTLSVYGDMEVSRLVEKPPGRKPIDTRIVSLDRLEEVIGRIAHAVEGGARVYWICPLVAESETSDLAAAEERHAMLAARLGAARVGLVHGRMKGPDKDRAMADFAAGRTRLLVATTVIEVGVDVPEATIMVIEHAERFGLAQLHQLRGRIGRGTASSTCLLLRAREAGETARRRLETLRATEDGFLIAEEDLKLRGAGELLGVRQSGLPTFHFADPERHVDLMAMARDEARLILSRMPELAGGRGEALRMLLYLFERDAGIRLMKSG